MDSTITLSRAVLGSCRAEMQILTRSMVFRISTVVLLFVIMSDFHSSAQSIGANVSTGFYMNQALILLGLYGSLLPAIAGAYLGGKEYDWGTRPWRLVVDGLGVLRSARMLLLVELSMVGSLVGAGLGGVFDIANGYNLYAVGAVAIRVLYLTGVMLFWGLVGFLFATGLRSFTWGAVIPVIWIVLEPLADFYLSRGINQVLPMWNIKVVLQALFPSQDGAVAVILPMSGDSVTSTLVFLAYLIVAVLLSSVAGRRRGN